MWHNENITVVIMKEPIALVTVMAVVGCFSYSSQEVAKPYYENTYTVENRYRQDVNDFPFIEIVSRDLPYDVIDKIGITYVRCDDREPKINLYMPSELSRGEYDQPAPGIVLVHGGGWRSGYRMHLMPLAIELAKSG